MSAIVFRESVGPILILAQIFGLISPLYTLGPTDRVVVRKTEFVRYLCVDLLRFAVLVLVTYVIHDGGFFYLQQIYLLKFWIILIAARVSEKWTIKFINAVLEFDRQLACVPEQLMGPRGHVPGKRYWHVLLGCLALYYGLFEVYVVLVWPPKKLNAILFRPFGQPVVMDFVVMVTAHFHLRNVECRFQTLVGMWNRLPPGLVAGIELTEPELAATVECVRLLHCQLCDLLNMLSYGYGPMLLAFFVFSFVDVLISFFFLFCIRISFHDVSVLNNVLRNLLTPLVNTTNIVFVTSVTVIASRIHDKKRMIFSCIRSTPISNLPADIKRQLKMFVNQISVSESDGITAFGLFNVNLKIVITILVLIVTGLATMIQMKKHPILLKLINDTNAYGRRTVELPKNR